MIRHRAFAILCALSMFLLTVTDLVCQAADERAVKAAYVFNLTKYVEWTSAGKELVICAIGDPAMADVLQRTLSGKVSESRTIRVITLSEDTALAHCHLIYVGHDATKKMLAGLEKVRGQNILTVGDTDSFAQRGGMVGLVRNGERIQIEINLEAVQEGGLKLSSRLLNVAVLMHSAPERKD